MKSVKLDLTGCKYLSEMHDRIRAAFGFPQWYGGNWSGFWDLLWSACDADRVIIKGESTVPQEYGEALSKLHEILERKAAFQQENHLPPFSFEIG